MITVGVYSTKTVHFTFALNTRWHTQCFSLLEDSLNCLCLFHSTAKKLDNWKLCTTGKNIFNCQFNFAVEWNKQRQCKRSSSKLKHPCTCLWPQPLTMKINIIILIHPFTMGNMRQSLISKPATVWYISCSRGYKVFLSMILKNIVNKFHPFVIINNKICTKFYQNTLNLQLHFYSDDKVNSNLYNNLFNPEFWPRKSIQLIPS